MHDPPSTRMTLIRRLGDPQDVVAWSTFVEQYAPMLYRYARSKGLQDADAADLVQEVLSSVSKHVDRFVPRLQKRSFRRWFYRIAHTKLCDLAEKRFRQPRPCGELPEDALQPERFSPEESGSWWETERRRELFYQAADEVRPLFQENTWKAFWATAVDGEPPQAIAERLGISIGAVYIAKSRVVARLKERVREHEASTDD